jgi:hypothetical protein
VDPYLQKAVNTMYQIDKEFGSSIILATVDIREAQILTKKLRVGNQFPCWRWMYAGITLFFNKGSKRLIEYDGPNTLRGLVGFVREQRGKRRICNYEVFLQIYHLLKSRS